MVLGIISRAAAAVGHRYRMIRKQKSRKHLADLTSDEELYGTTVWLEAVLLKRGKQVNNAYLNRNVVLTTEYVSYGNTHGGAVLDKIQYWDMAGVVWKRMTPNEWGTAFRQEPEFETERKDAQKLSACLDELDFAVCTTKKGYFRGRPFVFRTKCEQEREVWASSIARVFSAKKAIPPKILSTFQIWRRKARWLYLGDRCQIFVACLIFLNFVLNIAESQFLPAKGTSTDKAIQSMNLTFTALFTLELCVNMFATLVMEFFRDAWNWFDSVVVLVSLVSVFLDSLPGVSVLRLLRAFRVFRLFKRIPSLRQILVAINQSIPPMLNAFALVTLLTSIYSIMCVTFFKEQWPELFGDFVTASFTMFQIMTGDQWGDIARELFVLTQMGPAVACFFVSYQLLVALVLVNVVIAVLLEEFAKAAAAEKETGNKTMMSKGHGTGAFAERCPLERLVVDLQDFADAEDFETKIHLMFIRLTQAVERVNGETERLDGPTFRDGMAKFGMVPPITFTAADWDRLVVRQGLAAADGTIGHMEFGILLRQAFRRNQLRELTHVMEMEPKDWDRAAVHATMMAVKCILLESSRSPDVYDVPPSEDDLLAALENPAEAFPPATSTTIQPFHSSSFKHGHPLHNQAHNLAEELEAMERRLGDVELEALGRRLDSARTPRQRSRSLGDEDAPKPSEAQSLFPTTLLSFFTPTPAPGQSHANPGAATTPVIARTRSDPEEGRLTARRHSASVHTGNGWNFLANATQNPFDNVKDGFLGGLGAVGSAFPFLDTTPQAKGAAGGMRSSVSSPANTPPFSPIADARTPVEISSWRPARVKK